MIFATTGTQKFQFNRLLKGVDKAIETGIITEEVFAQTGASVYHPVHYKYRPFLPADEMQQLRKKSNIIITHSGTNSIIEGLKLGVPVIAVPRQSKFHEHVDDHQMEITEEFEKEGLIQAVYDITKLGEAIEAARHMDPPHYTGHGDRLLQMIMDMCTGKEKICS